MSTSVYAIVTTIQQPTECMKSLSSCLVQNNMRAVIVGDGKGPASFDLEACDFFSLESQRQLTFNLQPLLPTGHYARKNLGYLVAFKNGARTIFETDDDNAPTADWVMRGEYVEESVLEDVKGDSGSWCNVYRIFSPSFPSSSTIAAGSGSSPADDDAAAKQAALSLLPAGCATCDNLIWPRGLPLDRVRDELPSLRKATPSESGRRRCPIQQGLADGAPDVDAIWRLIVDRDYRFAKRNPVVLTEGVWCPFNSQNTWWFPVAFPLMYLPSFCSFRMTDIWRSFIAQRCLWQLKLGVEFHSADVVQDRNPHNLMRDFTDEIPGYTKNAALCKLLGQLELLDGEENVAANLLTCYTALVAAEYFPAKELDLVNAWLVDLKQVLSSQ